EESELAIVEKMPKVKLPNKLFRNTGRLTFDDKTEQIAGGIPTFSNGAIYADFDNDGDLDVVVNNIEDEPFIYKNLLRENPVAGAPAGSAYLSFRFKGQPGNLH